MCCRWNKITGGGSNNLCLDTRATDAHDCFGLITCVCIAMCKGLGRQCRVLWAAEHVWITAAVMWGLRAGRCPPAPPSQVILQKEQTHLNHSVSQDPEALQMDFVFSELMFARSFLTAKSSVFKRWFVFICQKEMNLTSSLHFSDFLDF